MKQKRKNKYGPKIETVKCLVILYQKDQNKSWLIFNTASKFCTFTSLVSSVYCKCGMIVESHHLWFYNHTKTIFWRVELLLTCTQNEKKGAWFFRGGA